MTDQAAAHYHEQIIASLTSGVIAVDRHGTIITFNPAAARHLGLPEGALSRGARLADVPGAEPFAALVRRVVDVQQPVSRHEIRVPQAHSAPKVIGLSASLLHGPNGVLGVILLFIDMTEVRNLERSVSLNRQLAQIGELTAGVVHELRSPLSVISGMAELLLRRIDPHDECRSPAETILDEAGRMERTIAQFLGFAKPFELDVRRCRPEDIADRVHRLCNRRALEKDVELASSMAPDLPEMLADLEKAAEALVNIVDNGIDAAPAGGNVALYTCRDQEEVVFEVTDNGPGIHLQPGQDVFKPFFSSKEGGTGLGLSIVQRIVSAHRGSVTYANRPEGGVRFEVRLPIQM